MGSRPTPHSQRDSIWDDDEYTNMEPRPQASSSSSETRARSDVTQAEDYESIFAEPIRPLQTAAQTPVTDFVKRLRKSKLFDEAKFKELVTNFTEVSTEEQQRDKTAFSFVSFCIEHRWITTWQVEQLLSENGMPIVVGPYRLLKMLGAGGMSRVYLAEQVSMKRKVAVKVLPQELETTESYRQRFFQEAEAIARLDHKNIVQAYDCIEAHNTLYLAMQYVKGIDLSALVEREGPLPFDKAADYIRQAADGLQHAHEAGLIHRDIKPANMLVDTKGVVKLLDLGIVRLTMEDNSSLTAMHQGQMLGTTDYMSPEQANDSHGVDARTDLYSLGCSMYYLLTGKPPFPTGTLAQKLLKHQIETPKKISELRPDVPRDLEAIVEKLMAKKPEERFGSAAEVAFVLQEWLQMNGFAPASVVGSTVSMPSLQSMNLSQAGLAPSSNPQQQAANSSAWMWIGFCLLAGVVFVGAFALVNVLAPPPTKTEPTRGLFPQGQQPQQPVATQDNDAETPANFARCKVKKVLNGDDIIVEANGKEEQVHLLNVDCPEQGQMFEDEASQFVKNLVEGKTVALEFNDETQVNRDKFGRLLAYVRLGAKNINVEIVRAGWSSYYTRFGKSKNYDSQFEAAEKEAKRNNRGIWND